ncbi:MAG: hypothetical protein NTV63_03445, partial [Candidatus Woesearchaeota archaeon]|nr:hypothetical protein [Candidatus Woesearchaeota archaeon]
MEKTKFKISRKGVATWISWVLIMAFTVALGTFVFRWSSGYAESSAADIGDRSARSSCDSAAIEIRSACQTEGVIYATIENKKDLRIDQIVFSMFDIFGNAESREKVISLGVGES